MNNQKPKLDELKLTPEQRDKLDQWKQSQTQLQVLEDLAAMMQEAVRILSDTKKGEEKQSQDMGALFVDMRESLNTLKNRKDPEAPDYSKPIVDAIEKLTKGLKFPAPQVKVDVPKLDAPQVNVSAPSVDLKGIEGILKKDIPSAFREAIQAMPQVEIPSYPDRWDDVLESLQSIDTASRMKTPFPERMKVTNSDGTDVGEKNYASRIDDTTTANTTYIGKAAIGSATSGAVWQIAKLDTSSGMVKTWADGDSLFNNIWDDRASLSYS